MIFGVVILPTLIEMPDQLNQHTTSCVLPASLQVGRKKNSETEGRDCLIFEGRDAVRRKSSRQEYSVQGPGSETGVLVSMVAASAGLSPAG